MNVEHSGRSGTLICYGDSNTYGYAPTIYGSFRYPDESLWPSLLSGRIGRTTENCGLCGREIPRSDRQIEAVRSLVRRMAEPEDIHRPAVNGAVPDEAESEGPSGGTEEESRARAVPVRLLVMLGTNDLLKQSGFLAEDVTVRMEHFLTGLLQEPLLREPGRLCLVVPPAMQPGDWANELRLIKESLRLNETYAALARQQNIPCIRTDNWDIPLVYDGVHFTEEGHRIFADHLAACLREL